MRPYPPEPDGRSFVPAPELELWARETFIDPSGRLYNEEHDHLNRLQIGFVWAFVDGSKGGRSLAGLCELMPPMAMGKWQRARAEQQVSEWFPDQDLDAMITILAAAADHYDDASFCALIEHELLHVGDDGFTQTGKQKVKIRPHDLEEFSSVVRRYGAFDDALKEMALALKHEPEVGRAEIRSACGTCLRLVG